MVSVEVFSVLLPLGKCCSHANFAFYFVVFFSNLFSFIWINVVLSIMIKHQFLRVLKGVLNSYIGLAYFFVVFFFQEKALKFVHSQL